MRRHRGKEGNPGLLSSTPPSRPAVKLWTDAPRLRQGKSTRPDLKEPEGSDPLGRPGRVLWILQTNSAVLQPDTEQRT